MILQFIKGIHNLKEKIYKFKDLDKYQKEINEFREKNYNISC